MARKRVERNISFDDARNKFYVNLDFGVDPATGKQIKKLKTFSKITQARAALRKHEAARDAGSVVLPKDTTVAQWLDRWMNDVVRLNRASTTAYAYQNIITAHIVPSLGTIPLQKLTPQHLQEYYAHLIRDKGLSSNTARKHHDLLNTALKLAVRQGVILSNPADRVEAPKVKRPEIHFYDMDHLRQLLQLCYNTRLEVMIKLAGLLGLRREEILGLTWSCVDFEHKVIHIKSVRTAAGKSIVVKEPKTDTSRRTLHMPTDLEGALRREQARQKSYRDYLGKGYCDEGYVVAHEDGRPMRPNYASELFVDFVRKQGLPSLTLHGLRHSFASIANAKGIPMYDIGKALGHSSPSTTSKVYTHLLDRDHRELLERMWEEAEPSAISGSNAADGHSDLVPDHDL